jgi:hypothetical protein
MSGAGEGEALGLGDGDGTVTPMAARSHTVRMAGIATGYPGRGPFYSFTL